VSFLSLRDNQLFAFIKVGFPILTLIATRAPHAKPRSHHKSIIDMRLYPIVPRIVPSMVKKFPVEVVPLKFVDVSVQDMTAFGLLKTGWTMQSTYAETTHRYMVDSTDVLLPKYMGESKQTRWVTGWVHSKTLINKYPEDPFIQQCSQLDAGGDQRHKIACLTEVEDEKAIMVRVATPVKIKIHGLLHQNAQLHQV
jgi:hypothetical protein